MDSSFTLVDSIALADLRTYLGRAGRVEDGSVRLIAVRWRLPMISAANVRSASIRMPVSPVPHSDAMHPCEPDGVWRRWTGIEPAGRGSLVPAALKAVESTRYPDTSAGECNRRRDD